MVRPRILAFLTTGNFSPLTVKGSKLCFVVLKSIWNSLHLSALRCNPLELDQYSTVETASWILLVSPFLTTSETVVSSTYFQVETSVILRSMIINKKSHDPSFVPWGTPAGTSPHSETQSFASLTLCFLSCRKSIVQRTTAFGIGNQEIFSASIPWSIRSNAFS